MAADATPPPLALAALEALRRGLRAIEVARAANTCLVVYRDGKIVRIPPDDLSAAEEHPSERRCHEDAE